MLILPTKGKNVKKVGKSVFCIIKPTPRMSNFVLLKKALFPIQKYCFNKQHRAYIVLHHNHIKNKSNEQIQL